MRRLTTQELNRPSPDELAALPRRPLVLVLDGVRSALNVGSIFRTADAFRLAHVHLCGITARPPHPEIHKTALGATETVPWTYWAETVSCLDALAAQGWLIAALEQTDSSVELADFVPPTSGLVVVVGHEIKGVSDAALERCSAALEIAQEGAKHSLNVAVAAGIACYTLGR